MPPASTVGNRCYWKYQQTQYLPRFGAVRRNVYSRKKRRLPNSHTRTQAACSPGTRSQCTLNCNNIFSPPYGAFALSGYGQLFRHRAARGVDRYHIDSFRPARHIDCRRQPCAPLGCQLAPFQVVDFHLCLGT